MRFTIETRKWYTAELIGEEFGEEIRSFSPIRINGTRAAGGRSFELDFYHANYPEGVRDKRYRLQTIERGKHFWFGRSLHHRPNRYLLIYSITACWLRDNFQVNILENGTVNDWLTQNVNKCSLWH